MLTEEMDDERGVGRFKVEFEIANYGDITGVQRGTLAPDQVRRRRIRGVVDSGATRVVLPESIVKQLGLPRGDRVKVRYADRRTATRETAQGVYVELLGRHAGSSAPSSSRDGARHFLARLCWRNSISSSTAHTSGLYRATHAS